MLSWTTAFGTLTSHDDMKTLSLSRRPTQVLRKGNLLFTFHPAPKVWWEALADGKEVIPVFPFRGRIFVGPRLDWANVCPTCFFLRLAQAFPHPDLIEPLFFHQPIADADAFQRLRHLLATAAQDHVASIRKVAGLAISVPIASSLADASGEPVTWCEHIVTPPPGDHPWHHLQWHWKRLLGPLEPHEKSESRLPEPTRRHIEDKWVGPIIEVRPAEMSALGPTDLVGTVAIAGFLGRLTTWSPDVTGSGLYNDTLNSRRAAIGEAVERYCGNYPNPAKIITCSREELASNRNSRIIGAERFGGWTDQKVFGNYGFRTSTADADEDWVRMVAPASNQEVFAPAEAVFLNYTRHTGRTAQFPVMLAGIAAGANLRDAAGAGFLELLERDAAMVWWHGGGDAFRLRHLPSDPTLNWRSSEEPIHLSHYALPVRIEGALCVASVLNDPRREILVMGFACRTDLAAATRKATAECWQLYKLSNLLSDPESGFWAQVRSGKLPLPTVPFRTDRSYAQAFSDDFSDMDQLAYNLQYFLDPSTQGPVLGQLERHPSWSWDEALQHCNSALDGWDLLVHSSTAVVADLTTTDISHYDYRVARVIDTHLVGNYATAFTPWWHARLANTPLAVRRRTPIPHA